MHAVVPYSSQQAGGAQSRTIPYRSRRFGIGSSLGYAAFEWLGSTWGLRGWSQQPPGITPMPATQPLSKRPLREIFWLIIAQGEAKMRQKHEAKPGSAEKTVRPVLQHKEVS